MDVAVVFGIVALAYMAVCITDAVAYGVVLDRYLARGHSVDDWLASKDRIIARRVFGATYLRYFAKDPT